MRIVGYPRMDVTVLHEVIERNVPPNIKDNPTEIRAYVSRELDTIRGVIAGLSAITPRSEEHTSELQSLMRISYAVFCLKKKKKKNQDEHALISPLTKQYTKLMARASNKKTTL